MPGTEAKSSGPTRRIQTIKYSTSKQEKEKENAPSPSHEGISLRRVPQLTLCCYVHLRLLPPLPVPLNLGGRGGLTCRGHDHRCRYRDGMKSLVCSSKLKTRRWRNGKATDVPS